MVIEVTTNVNVPFGTVNVECRGQEEIEGRIGIIYFALPLCRISTLRGEVLGKLALVHR